jgi:hypothetical protein
VSVNCKPNIKVHASSKGGSANDDGRLGYREVVVNGFFLGRSEIGGEEWDIVVVAEVSSERFVSNEDDPAASRIQLPEFVERGVQLCVESCLGGSMNKVYNRWSGERCTNYAEFASSCI